MQHIYYHQLCRVLGLGWPYGHLFNLTSKIYTTHHTVLPRTLLLKCCCMQNTNNVCRFKRHPQNSLGTMSCLWSLVRPQRLLSLCTFSTHCLSYLEGILNYLPHLTVIIVGVSSVKNFFKAKTHICTSTIDKNVCIQVYSPPVSEINHTQKIGFLEDILSKFISVRNSP